MAASNSWDMVSRSAKKYLGLGAIVVLLLLLYYHGGSRTGKRSSADSLKWKRRFLDGCNIYCANLASLCSSFVFC